MRKNDREITEQNKIEQIIQSCHCCRLGLSDGDKIYIVPLNFAFVHNNEQQVFYFHSARQGKKIHLINQNEYAGFELDTNHHLKTSDVACGYSFGYQSVIGFGKISIVLDNEEKEQALQFIMEHYTGKNAWSFDKRAMQATAIIKLVVEEISCKENL